MSTIKHYTDLSQSKVLAEILPLESADMKWFFWKEETDAPKTPTFGYSKSAAKSYKDTKAIYLPCWSLASLLSVLQNPSLHKTYTGWRCDTYNENCTKCELGDTADNPVDACYELILKLHKLKML